MKQIIKRDIYHIYEIEAQEFKLGKVDHFWKNLFQLGATFVFMVFVVFFMINFRFMSSQLADWFGNRDRRMASEIINSNVLFSEMRGEDDLDSDGDGLGDRIENILGTSVSKPDSDNDGFSDFEELINKHNPLGDGIIKAEIELTGQEKIPISWKKEKRLSKVVILDENDLIFYNTFRVSSDYLNKIMREERINILFYLGDKRKIQGVYERGKSNVYKTSGEIEKDDDEIQFIANWPSGTDWKKKVFNAKLVSASSNN